MSTANQFAQEAATKIAEGFGETITRLLAAIIISAMVLVLTLFVILGGTMLLTQVLGATLLTSLLVTGGVLVTICVVRPVQGALLRFAGRVATGACFK